MILTQNTDIYYL